MKFCPRVSGRMSSPSKLRNVFLLAAFSQSLCKFDYKITHSVVNSNDANQRDLILLQSADKFVQTISNNSFHVSNSPELPKPSPYTRDFVVSHLNKVRGYTHTQRAREFRRNYNIVPFVDATAKYFFIKKQ